MNTNMISILTKAEPFQMTLPNGKIIQIAMLIRVNVDCTRHTSIELSFEEELSVLMYFNSPDAAEDFYCNFNRNDFNLELFIRIYHDLQLKKADQREMKQLCPDIYSMKLIAR